MILIMLYVIVMNNYVKYAVTVYIIYTLYTIILYYLWDSIVKGLTDDVHHVLVKNYKTDVLQKKTKCDLLKMRKIAKIIRLLSYR